MKSLLIILAILIGFFIPAPSGAAVLVQLLDQTFIRGTGEPRTEFSSFPSGNGQVTISLLNGAANSDRDRVSSASIEINGQVIFAPSNFNQNVSSLQKIIPFASSGNSLSVNLNGKPGSQIRIKITQQVEEAPVTYTYTDLLPPGFNQIFYVSMNNKGQVVGEAIDGAGQTRGFLYSSGSYTTIHPPGWHVSMAVSINDNGQVAGSGYDSASVGVGFLYGNGTYTILPYAPGFIQSWLHGINNNGQVVGTGFNATWQRKGLLYSDGSYVTLLPPGWQESEGVSINDNGQVVGRGIDAAGLEGYFLYSNGNYTTILPPGLKSLNVLSFNNRGELVGYGYDGSGQLRGFLYSNGTCTILLPPGKPESLASCINNNGDVVGTSPYYGLSKGFLYSNGEYTTILPPEMYGSFLNSINDSGQVVGEGFNTARQKQIFLYRNGTYNILSLPLQDKNFSSLVIKNNGYILGRWDDATAGGYFVLSP